MVPAFRDGGSSGGDAREPPRNVPDSLLSRLRNVPGTFRKTIVERLPVSLSATSAALQEGQPRAAGDLQCLLEDRPLLVVCLHETVVDRLGEVLDGGVLPAGVVLPRGQAPTGPPAGADLLRHPAGGHRRQRAEPSRFRDTT